MPCVAFRPSECTSLMNISRPASFIVLVMPNSLAALTALMVSPPALARPRICALLDCACSMNDEKSLAESGARTEPTTLPPDGQHDLGRVGLQLRAERVVGGQEVPALAAGLDDGGCGALGQRDRVVGVVHGVRRALLVGQRRAARADRPGTASSSPPRPWPSPARCRSWCRRSACPCLAGRTTRAPWRRRRPACSGGRRRAARPSCRRSRRPCRRSPCLIASAPAGPSMSA